MPFWIYLLRCADGTDYTGHTDGRLAQHDAGTFGGYTQFKKPLQLAYSQEVPSREEALAAEMQIKRWNRRKKAALVSGDWEGLRLAAKKDFKRSDPPF